MYIPIGFLLLTIVYLLYVQFSPGMGDIWYNVMIFPLQHSAMWNISMWDINYFVWIAFYIFIIILHRLHQNYLLPDKYN